MAAVPAPPGRSLLGHVVMRLTQRAKAKGRRPSRAAAFMADHTGTMAALGFAVTAMWHLGTFWGLLGSAVAIVIAEDKVRG